ncbi:PREDICTED: uncharacterized protein LOC105124950 [Populus euphratica]|uniref:Uncharacterized protein LOC105124950 n=1 Tax=Populus euphratica TaxID=75702 RepID=A0AAJ6U635_POPEU|nr:PREDICTED: uncharacterized protein LOC105124950 [Populus euphratica]
MVCGCSLSDGHHHVDGDFKKGFLENREKETGVEEKELTPVQGELVEALVWFKERNFTTKESLKAKISTMASCSAHQSVNPPGCFVPKKRRACGDGFLSVKGPLSNAVEEAKSTVTSTVDELRLSSKKTQSCPDQEDAMSTNSSVDGVENTLGIVVPMEKRGNRKSNVKKSHYHHYVCSHVDGLKLTIERQEEKKNAAGKNPIFKLQRIENEDGQGERPSEKRKKMGRVDFNKLGLDPAPNFSSQIKDRIDHQDGRDSEIKLRIMKQVFKTDMNMHHDRFPMPVNQIKDIKDFLKENEIEGTEVKLVEMGLKDDDIHQSTMRLRKCHINSNISYVLASNWSGFLRRNEGALKENDIVQVYSFRRDGKLWCVLIKIMDADDVARSTAASERSTAQENNNGDHGTVAGQAFHRSQASEEGARISQA